jgi:UDP-perosamine 4-acetyltransferase
MQGMDALIIGAGGHGKVVLDILRAAGMHRPVGFVDADPSLSGQVVSGLPVLGQINLLPKLRGKARGAVIAIGDNRTRLHYADLLRQHDFELLSAIHPSAVVSGVARLGQGVVVAAGAVVGTDTAVGDCAIINTSAIVDHECQLDSGVHVCPGAALAGRVHVQEMAFLGLGCRIIQCLTIGRNAVVGAGAVVIRDVPDGATVVGVPAQIIKSSPLDASADALTELCKI